MPRIRLWNAMEKVEVSRSLTLLIIPIYENAGAIIKKEPIAIASFPVRSMNKTPDNGVFPSIVLFSSP
jgi:hypothetical protein